MKTSLWLALAFVLAIEEGRAQTITWSQRIPDQRRVREPRRRQTLLLNEVLYLEDVASVDPLRNHEWVEIVNVATEAVSLGGWVLADRDGPSGTAARTLPSAEMPPGSYLVVHVGSGTDDLDFSDGYGTYFTGDPAGTDLFQPDDDDCALYAAGVSVDYVCWSQGTPYVPEAAHADAVAANGWTTGDYLDSLNVARDPSEKIRPVRPGSPIGRDGESTDTDEPEDWDTEGGASAMGATQGRPNLDLVPIVPVVETPPPAASWTLLVYLDGDHNLEKNAYEDVKEMEAAGGSDSSVNVVVMIDGLDMLVQAALDGSGDPVPALSTRGGTWRFRVGPEVDPRYVRMLHPSGQDPYLGERNMGDGAELSAFIAWAQANYPATNYGLIVWDHGRGWKGVCADDTTDADAGVPEPARPKEGLFMGELSAALAGSSFELIGFDACLMGMIEVAWQVQPFCDYLVASEASILADGWPYDAFLPGLKANPGWSGAALGARIVADFTAFWGGPGADPDHSIACIDEAALPGLLPLVSIVADDLALGCDDFQSHESPLDNVEHLLSLQAETAQRFDDPNYVDLFDFMDQVFFDPMIPFCYKDFIPPMQAALLAAVVAEANGPGRPGANGLSIHMPLLRTRRVARRDDPYDDPSWSRIDTGASARAGYAPNPDCLPYSARDVETGAGLAAPGQWVLRSSPGFDFPADTSWDDFLNRYYHPVADIWILYGFCPNPPMFFSPTAFDPGCGANSVASITVCPCAVVFFSGAGSSDADTVDKLAMRWMWDFDELMPAGAITPYALPAGVDAAMANDDMDLDCDPGEFDDEKQAEMASAGWTFPIIRDYVVTMNAWDDNHMYPNHNTLPDATYVHPQADGHVAIVSVVPCEFLH